MKIILILNGSPKRNGKTASLLNAFMKGAKDSGNEVRDLYLQNIKIKGCLACDACKLGKTARCVQHDDMDIIYNEFIKADIIVFVSPMMWGGLSGQLRLATDRFYALCNTMPDLFKDKKIALLMTAGADEQMPTQQLYALPLAWYGIWKFLGMKSIGEVLGYGKEDEARKLGESIH